MHDEGFEFAVVWSCAILNSFKTGTRIYVSLNIRLLYHSLPSITKWINGETNECESPLDFAIVSNTTKYSCVRIYILPVAKKWW